MASSDRKRSKPSKKLVDKYILEIRDEETFEKKISYRLSRLNVITALGLTFLVIVVLVVALIDGVCDGAVEKESQSFVDGSVIVDVHIE